MCWLYVSPPLAEIYAAVSGSSKPAVGTLTIASVHVVLFSLRECPQRVQ